MPSVYFGTVHNIHEPIQDCDRLIEFVVHMPVAEIERSLNLECPPGPQSLILAHCRKTCKLL